MFATPEYNASVPGALKNALDWISRPIATNVLRNKPVAVLVPLVQPGEDLYPLLAVSGGRYSAIGGGVPVTNEGQVIAGVGVSGGTVEEDVAIVEAAMATS